MFDNAETITNIAGNVKRLNHLIVRTMKIIIKKTLTKIAIELSAIAPKINLSFTTLIDK